MAKKQQPGCCGCGSGGTAITFKGCNNGPLANYTLEIYSASGGSLLETVTTDGSGVANVTSTGTKWVKSADGRFSGDSVSMSSPVTLTTIHSSYACSLFCVVPLKKTLFLTSSVFGSVTLTWSGSTCTTLSTFGTWSGTKVYAFTDPAGCVCLPTGNRTVCFMYNRSTIREIQLQVPYTNVGSVRCPGGVSWDEADYSGGTRTCITDSTSFSISGRTYTTSGSCILNSIYVLLGGGVTDTVGITE